MNEVTIPMMCYQNLVYKSAQLDIVRNIVADNDAYDAVRLLKIMFPPAVGDGGIDE